MENYNRLYNEIYREAIPGFVGSAGYAKRANNKLDKASTKANAKYATAKNTLKAACGELAMEIVNLQKKWTLKGAFTRKNMRNGANNTGVKDVSTENSNANPALVSDKESLNTNMLISRFLEDVKGNENMNNLLKNFGINNVKDPKPIASYLYNMAVNPQTTNHFQDFLQTYMKLFNTPTLAGKRADKAYQGVIEYIKQQSIQANINSKTPNQPTLNNLAGSVDPNNARYGTHGGAVAQQVKNYMGRLQQNN